MYEMQRCHVALKEYELAQGVINDYLKSAEEEKDRRAIAIAYEIRGDVLREAERYPEALEAYKKSLDAGQTPERCENWSPRVSLNKIRQCHVALKEYEVALKVIDEFLKSAEEDQDRRAIAIAYKMRGESLRMISNHKDAIVNFGRAVEFELELAPEFNVVDSDLFKNQAECQWLIGLINEAKSTISQFVSLAIAVRGSIYGVQSIAKLVHDVDNEMPALAQYVARCAFDSYKANIHEQFSAMECDVVKIVLLTQTVRVWKLNIQVGDPISKYLGQLVKALQGVQKGFQAKESTNIDFESPLICESLSQGWKLVGMLLRDHGDNGNAEKAERQSAKWEARS